MKLMENTFDTSTTFDKLGIAPPILKALSEMGFEAPTEVQSRAIPHILDKKDTIVKSKTGSGKTAVFGVSMLQLTDPGAEGPQGLILTPTRELAVQVDNDIRQMAKHLTHKTTAVYGQHSMNTEVGALNKGVTIVTGTPGRVYDHIQQGNLKTKHIRFLVLDEADRMLDMGFIDQVEKIIRTLPKDRVTLLFSATIPDEVKRICTRYMKEPETIEIESETKTVDTICQLYYRVERNEKRTQLERILLAERPESCMIFCNTRIAVDQVRSYLNRKGYACQALHGDIPQAKRIKTIEQFKKGEFHLLAATDVAARGIHIDDLSLVINYDVPVEKDSYVHRIGRTGRAGHEGRAISIVSVDDVMNLYEIEEHIGVLIEESVLPTDEFLAEHKAEIDEWKKINEVKAVPETRTTRAKGSKNGGGRDNSRDRGGARSRRPVKDKPPEVKDTAAGKSGHPDDQNRSRTAGSGKGRGNTAKGDKSRKQHGGRPEGRPPAHGRTEKAPYPKRDTETKRQQAGPTGPHPAADSKKAGSPGITKKPATTELTQKPAEKKGLLRRIAEKIFGRK